MKKVLAVALLAVLAISAKGEPTAEELKSSYKLVTGESLAIVMAGMDEIVLPKMEELFRSKLKSYEEYDAEQVAMGSNSTVRITYTQKTYINKIVKDMYYSEIRPIYRDAYSKMKGPELSLIASAFESDGENQKAVDLNSEVIKEVRDKTVEVLDMWVMKFSIGCSLINEPPAQSPDKEQSDKE
jgi:hypothetical protein